MYKSILFDLDGTLTDSSEGITKCVKLSLEHFGINQYETSQLTPFIGPPLRDMFVKYGVPEDRVEEAVSVYRSRYNVVGKFENRPYDGIKELLRKLKEDGCRVYLATSKPEHLAQDILDKFELSQYFDIICGATEDGRIDSKESVIRYLFSRIGEGELDSVLMVGDTNYDVIGAAACNIPTVGVRWGFGCEEEMLEAGAIAMVSTTDELYELIHSH